MQVDQEGAGPSDRAQRQRIYAECADRAQALAQAFNPQVQRDSIKNRGNAAIVFFLRDVRVQAEQWAKERGAEEQRKQLQWQMLLKKAAASVEATQHRLFSAEQLREVQWVGPLIEKLIVESLWVRHPPPPPGEVEAQQEAARARAEQERRKAAEREERLKRKSATLLKKAEHARDAAGAAAQLAGLQWQPPPGPGAPAAGGGAAAAAAAAAAAGAPAARAGPKKKAAAGAAAGPAAGAAAGAAGAATAAGGGPARAQKRGPGDPSGGDPPSSSSGGSGSEGEGGAGAGSQAGAKKKRKRVEKEYVPQVGTANYAFLIVLYMETKRNGPNHYETKESLMNKAEASGLSNRPIKGTGNPNARMPGERFYDGWSSFNKSLANREPPLVMAYSNPKKVRLVPLGMSLAARLYLDAVERGKVEHMPGVDVSADAEAVPSAEAAPAGGDAVPGPAAPAGAKKAAGKAAAGRAAAAAAGRAAGAAAGGGGARDPAALHATLEARIAAAEAALRAGQAGPQARHGDEEGSDVVLLAGEDSDENTPPLAKRLKRGPLPGQPPQAAPQHPQPPFQPPPPAASKLGAAAAAAAAAAAGPSGRPPLGPISGGAASGRSAGGTAAAAAAAAAAAGPSRWGSGGLGPDPLPRQQSGGSQGESSGRVPLSQARSMGGGADEGAAGSSYQWRLPRMPPGGPPPAAQAKPRLPPLPPGKRFEDVYEVVLLLDSREQMGRAGKSSRTESLQGYVGSLRARGVTVDVDSLLVGDAVWLARNKQYPAVQYVLDHVVERKRVDDLASSIKDGRYAKQKWWLARCGLRNFMYLVEGDPESETKLSEIEVKSVKTGTLAAEKDGFRVLHTTGCHDTLDLYVRLTKAMQRSYHGRTAADGDAPATGSAAGPSQGSQQYEDGVPQGAALMQLQAWREAVDRMQSQHLTVRRLFGLQLCAIKGMGEITAEAITREYATWHDLHAAFKRARAEAAAKGQDPDTAARQLLTRVRLTTGTQTVGPSLAAKVYDHLFMRHPAF